MIWVAAFVLFFAGGPLMFRALTKAPPSRAGLRRLARLAVGFGLGAVALAYLPAQDPPQVWRSLASILLLWLGWVSILAYATQALRRLDRSLRMKRLSGVIGALGTTIPWFGLASANMVWG